jgi:hypothetical protein
MEISVVLISDEWIQAQSLFKTLAPETPLISAAGVRPPWYTRSKIIN